MPHGVSTGHGEDEPAPIAPERRLRQPDAGPVPDAEADASGSVPAQRQNYAERLDQRGQRVSRSDEDSSSGIKSRSVELEALEALQYQIETRWEGPMPSPAMLAQYEQIQAGLAERIMAMAETAVTGDIRSRDKVADAAIARARTGQIMAYSLTLIALTAAVLFFIFRDPIAGGVLVSVPVIMLIRSFLSPS